MDMELAVMNEDACPLSSSPLMSRCHKDITGHRLKSDYSFESVSAQYVSCCLAYVLLLSINTQLCNMVYCEFRLEVCVVSA